MSPADAEPTDAKAESAYFRSFLVAFWELSADTVKELASQAQLFTLNPGQKLFKAGESNQRAVFVIHAGEIDLLRHDRSILTLGPGDVLGVANYFEDSSYLATATARSAVQIYALPEPRLRAMERRYPEVSNALHRLLSDRLRSQTTQPVTGVWALPARAVMQSPLATCLPTTTVAEAFATMQRRRIGSLGIVDESKRLLGILTFATLAHGLISRNAKPEDMVLDIASEEPRVVNVDLPLWKVQYERSQQVSKYLVVEENAKPVGIISQTDILSKLLAHQPSIFVRVDEVADFAELKNFTGRLGQIAHDLSENHRSASRAVRALSEVHLAIQRRCIELVLADLRAAGMGDPPVSYAFLIMGSGGRKEMVVRTDQDNGIILADEPETDSPATRAWFMEFCDQINHRLDELGYEWCTGGIMARNPDFHKSLTEWRQHLSRITELPNEKKARWSSIFFDFETLYGDDRLTMALRAHLFDELRQKPGLIKSMVEDDATGGPALGLFNRLVTATDGERKGKIDLKRNGTRIMADAGRIYALSEGISATNTGDRLTALVRQGRLDNAFVQSLLVAYDELLALTLGHQLRQWEKGQIPDKLLDLDELTPLEEESLRMAMRVIKHLQSRMQGEFGITLL